MLPAQYRLLFKYLRALWADAVNLVPANAPINMGEAFYEVSVQEITYVKVRGLRYGATHRQRGQKFRFAYIEGRNPVRIAWIYHIKHRRRDPTLPPLEHTCALIQRFQRDDRIPSMPWDIRYAHVCVCPSLIQSGVI